MAYACPTWEYEADAHLLELQRLQNRALRAAAILDMCLPVHEFQVNLKKFYVYEHITKLCMTQAEVIPNHVNPNIRGIGQGEARNRNYKRLKLGGGKAYDRSAD
jgi:hypothetical protein